MRRIQIDINRRNRAGQTPAPYAGPTPRIGEHVIAFEPEDGICADAVIAAVNPDRCIVALDVDWETMRDDVLDRLTATQTSGGPFTLNTSGDLTADGGWTFASATAGMAVVSAVHGEPV